MKNLEKLIDRTIKIVEEFTSQILKLVFRLVPIMFILYVFIALLVKAFKVIVLGDNS